MFYFIKNFCELKLSKLMILLFFKYYCINWNEMECIVFDFDLLVLFFICDINLNFCFVVKEKNVIVSLVDGVV